jgi:Cu+-exporting ATPase
LTYARPEGPNRPCPACGTAVEPLRAGAVLLFDDGFRFLCNGGCRERFLAGDHAFERTPEPPAPQKTFSATAPILAAAFEHEPFVADSKRPRGGAFEKKRLLFRAAVALGIFGALLAPFAEGSLLRLLSAVAAIFPAALPLVFARDRNTRFLLAPTALGVALATVAGLIGRDVGTAWLLFAANWAAVFGVLRSALDDESQARIDFAVERLHERIPSLVRIPDVSSEDPLRYIAKKRDASRLRAGEEIIVLEGETAGVDGTVRAGEARVLLHPTAEVPARRGPGDPILAGARVVEGSLRILATRVGHDRALARPGELGKRHERDAARLTLLASTLTTLGPIALGVLAVASGLLDDDATWASRIAGVSAIFLGAPLLAVRRAAESPFVAASVSAVVRGIVFESSRALERAGRTSRTVLCTHGTITEGKPSVVELHSLEPSGESNLIALAAAAEASAEAHPIALAVQAFAKARGIAPESVRRATFLRGRGVTALAPGGEPFVFGSRQLLLDEGVSVAVVDDEALRAEARGRTIVFVGFGGRVRGLMSLADPMRSGARAAVQRIMDLGSEVVLISGDHRGTVEALARKLDIDHVKAELLPDERGAEVQRLRDAGGLVAVVGSPKHDESALLAADVPVVLGAAGDIAGERGLALATEDLRDAAIGLWLAHAALQVAWRAFFVATATTVVLAFAALSGWVGPLLASTLAFAADAYVLPAGARLLARIERRIPSRNA